MKYSTEEVRMTSSKVYHQRDGEKWIDSGYTLEVDLRSSADGLDVGMVQRKLSRVISRILS